MIFDLVQDFHDALASMPTEHSKRQMLDILHQAIDLSFHVVVYDPLQLRSQLWGRLVDIPIPALHKFREQMKLTALMPWLRLKTPTLTSPGGPVLRTLPGHPTAPVTVLVCPDGQHLLSASSGRVVLWDIETGKTIISGSMGQCATAVLFPDGRRFASAWGYWLPRDNLGNPMGLYGNSSCEIIFRDLISFELLQKLKGHDHAIRSMIFTKEGDKLISTANDTKVWDTISGEELFACEAAETLSVTDVMGSRFLLTGMSHHVNIWDIDTHQKVYTLSSGKWRLCSMVILLSRDKAILASMKGDISIWNLRTGKCIQTFKIKMSFPKLVLSGDEERLVIYCSDGRTEVWDVNQILDVCHQRHFTPCIATFREDMDTVNDVSVTHHGSYAVFALGSKFSNWDYEPTGRGVTVWDITSCKRLKKFQQHKHGVRSIRLLPDGRRAVSTSWDGSIIIWDLSVSHGGYSQQGHKGSVTDVAIHSRDSIAVTGSQDHTLKTWDLATGRFLTDLIGHKQPVSAVELLEDDTVVSASIDGTVSLWNVHTGRKLISLHGHPDGVCKLKIIENHNKVISTYFDGSIRIWNLHIARGSWILRWLARRPLQVLMGHSKPVTAIAILADGQLMLTGSSDLSMRLWNLISGLQLRTISDYVLYPMEFAILPDNRRVVVALHGFPTGTFTDDQTVEIWDIQKAERLMVLKGHHGETTFVRLLPDNQRAVTASVDGSIRVWDIQDGQELHALRGHMGPIQQIAVFPDGHRVASVCLGGLIKIWDIDSGHCITTFFADGTLSTCAVAKDGQTLIAGEQSGTVHVLCLEQGKIAFPNEAHPCPFSPRSDINMVVDPPVGL